MAPSPLKKSKKPRRSPLEKRVKALYHVQKPRGKQKKMTDFFPPSPKSNGNKSNSENETENQLPSSNSNSNNHKDASPQKYNTRPRKSEPRVFYGYEPDTRSSHDISPRKPKRKSVLKENSLNIPVETKKGVNAITSLKASNIDCCKNNEKVEEYRRSPPKSPAGDLYKPQRNARRIYLKYGTRIPSFNDIVKSRENLLRFKEDVASVAELQKISPKFDAVAVLTDSPKNSDHLDCKHIAREKLKEIFQDYTDFIIGVANGTVPSERHKLYMEDPYGSSEFDQSELTFNISMSAFTSKQKVFLAHLTKKVLCANKLLFDNQYYFKVVLPDLCFKMFMKEHKLTEEEATEYLSNPHNIP